MPERDRGAVDKINVRFDWLACNAGLHGSLEDGESGTCMNEVVSSIQGSRSVIVCSSFLTDGRQRQPCSIGELADVVLLGSVGSSIVAIPAGLAALAIRVIASEQDSIGFVSMEKPFEGSNDGDPV